MLPAPSIHPTAVLGANVKVWAGTQVREHASIGDGTSVGQFCYVGPGVIIGRNCSIQNQAQIYEPAVIHDSVFIGPSVVLTNDLNPRAVNGTGSRKTPTDWTAASAEIAQGASIGAGVICVGPVKIGEWAMVAAGAVVTIDVANYSLVAGVPARQIGWVGQAGYKLTELNPSTFICPNTGTYYFLDKSGSLTSVSR